jgi:hypothetical protein
MADLRNKIASLEIQMKIQLVKRDNQASWEKRDRKAGKKGIEQKVRSMEIHAVIESEKRDRLLENEKRDRLLENEKRDRLLENERRDRLLENERRDRKDLEQKMEVMKMQAAHALENEKRDRDAALEKKETQHQIENEKRDRMLENERRDRETQHQIEQLKWEARFGQMEQQQQHNRQPIVTSPVQPLPHIVNPSPTQQGEREQWLLQQLHDLKLHKNEHKNESSQQQPPLPVPAAPAMSQESMVAPSAPIPSLPAGPHNAMATARSMQGNITTTGFQSAQPGKKSTAVALPSAPGSTGSSAPLAPLTKPSKVVRPQHQVSIGPAARGGSIPLPGDASNHFFLSHCQATGGDQTNAIYLELRQLGFCCW